MSETICGKFLDTSRRHNERIAVMYKRAGRWNELTWDAYREIVESIAAGLQVLGLRKGDRVAILSNTRYEWAATDLAVLGLGAVTVPIYANSTPEDIQFILGDCGARILVCESSAMYAKIRDLVKTAKTVEYVVVFDRGASTDPGETVSLQDLEAKGAVAIKRSPGLFPSAIDEVTPADPATIVYTSGTTGRPRGVLHTHTQILSEVADAYPLLGVTQRDRSLTCLPLAHVLGRIEIFGHALTGFTMAFAQSIERIRDDLVDIKPTIMIAVPRVFEKFHNGVLAQVEINQITSRAFKWALGIGREVSRHKIDKLAIPLDLAIKYRLATQIVFKPILNKLGGNLRFAVCGGAPLNPVIAEFFHAAGLLILEGYGLTETMAAISVNTPFAYRFGTVGQPIGDVKIKLAEDGEILVNSKKVMREYFHDPEATAQVLQDGWFHTGDIGEFTADGFLRITDRKKDLIKTAGGKYVAPQRLEGLLKVNRYVSQVHIHGDQRKFIVALVTLNIESVRQFARDNGIRLEDHAEQNFGEIPKIRELIRKVIAETNTHLASWESIKNFAILPRDFSIETGELTPSLKVKRKVVDRNYKEVIDKLYGAET